MSRPLTFHTVTTARELREFLDVPIPIYRHDPRWIQPLYTERKQHFSAANPFYEHAEVRLRVARDAQGRAVGRISCQHDTRAPQADGHPEGHFGFIEAEDPEVMQGLLADAEAWFRGRGVTRVVGPYSLSSNDESGLLVEGFDTAPRLMMNYAPRWYGPAIEAAGYTKAKDLLGFLVDLEQDLPPGAYRMARRATNLRGFSERALRMGDFDAELLRVGNIFNDAWRHNWGFVPLTEREITHLGVSLKPIVVPELARFVEIDGRPVGMVVALADFNEAMRGLEGKLLPFGWARLLWRVKVKGIRTARVVLMGIGQELQKDFRGAAMIAALLVALYQALRREQFTQLDLSWVLEDNKPTLTLCELFGGVLEKRYRLYQKRLA